MIVTMNSYKQVTSIIRPLLQFKTTNFKCARLTVKSFYEPPSQVLIYKQSPKLTSCIIFSNERQSATCVHHNYFPNNVLSDRLNNLFSNVIRRDYSSLRSIPSVSFAIQESLKRFKSKKTSKRPEYDSDSDDEDGGEGESKATKPIIIRLQSLRIDGLLKKGLGIARNKVETVFYEGGLRINGAKPSKKSSQVQVGDEVDLIKGVSPMNPDFLMISRVEVLSVKEDTEEEDQLLVKIRRTKTMYIENYVTDPWKKTGQ